MAIGSDGEETWILAQICPSKTCLRGVMKYILFGTTSTASIDVRDFRGYAPASVMDRLSIGFRLLKKQTRFEPTTFVYSLNEQDFSQG